MNRRCLTENRIMAYYGFSLLCYLQRECNSRFNKRECELDGRSARVVEARGRRVEEEGARGVAPQKRGKLSSGNGNGNGNGNAEESVGLIEVEEVEEVEEEADFFRVEKLWGGVMPGEVVKAIGDAALECGGEMVEKVWEVSQFVADRKRAVLIMTGFSWSSESSGIEKKGTGGVVEKKGRRVEDAGILAVSCGKVRVESIGKIGGDRVVYVGARECAQLGEVFFRLVRERELV